jgi:hypothetical protein
MAAELNRVDLTVSKRRNRPSTSPERAIADQAAFRRTLAEGGAVELNTWLLDAPDRSYWASSTLLQIVAGDAIVYFLQVGPTGRPINAIGVRMALWRFEEALPTLAPLREGLGEKLARLYPNANPVKADLAGMAEMGGRFLTIVSSQLFRGSANDDSVLLDFFAAPAISPQALGNPNTPLLPVPLVRVQMSPVTFSGLLAQIDAGEAR